jgi:prolyl-tRNA synthetase
MYDRANNSFREHRQVVTNWDDVMPVLEAKNLLLIPFCLAGKCEDRIKQLTTKGDDQTNEQGAASMGMKSLCIPFEQPCQLDEGTKCLSPDCGSLAEKWTLFGRGY